MVKNLDIFEVREIAASIYEHFAKPENMNTTMDYNNAKIFHHDYTYLADDECLDGCLKVFVTHDKFNLGIIADIRLLPNQLYVLVEGDREELAEWLAVWKWAN